MKTQKIGMRFLSILLVMMLALSACAVDQPAVVVEPETIEEEPAAEQPAAQPADAVAGVGDAADVLVTASSLLDYSFENIDGEVSGEIEDLIVDLATGDVLYATLEYGGFLDIGDTELPVPLNAFVWGGDGELVLAFEEAALENFPDLGTDWPDLTTPGWDDEVVNFWRGIGIEPGVEFTEASDTVAQVSEVIGYGITDVGLGAGNLQDMLIDLGESQVEYGLLAYDPGLFNNELIAVPFDAFNITTLGDQLAFDEGIDATVLEEAPRFGLDAFAAGASQAISDIETYWAERGFDTDATAVTETAEETDEAIVTEEEPIETTGAVGVAGAENVLVRASTLLDYSISNLAGENIGEIEDMLIDVETGRILFATLEYGGFLDIGDSEVPVPLSAFDWGAENELILNVEEEQLDALPDVGADWPDVTDPAWNDEIVNFWSGLGVDPGFAAADAQTVMYVSNLIDYGLEDVGFGAEGSIHNVLIDLAQSHAPYAVVDYGGLFDNNLVAIPFSAVDVSLVDDGFRFTPNVDLETLQAAPTIEREGFEQAGLFDAGFDDEITTYWEDAGYPVGVE